MEYQKAKNEKGILRESSKILEEVRALQDAEQQGAQIMILCKLARIFGAVQYYLDANYPNFNMHDLQKMASSYSPMHDL